MFSGRITQATLRVLDWLAEHVLPPDQTPAHQRTGRRGEERAYFHLRRLGYTMVARNFRSPRCRGEIDLIGWEDDVLCFVEVKTRSTRDVKPAEAAVTDTSAARWQRSCESICDAFHLRASGASTLSAYTMGIQKPAGRRSKYFAIPP
ncbi:MAG: YraN family protein [Candidatus Sulfotelmatobacter sp.]